jgi:hypothetical protein
MRLGQLSRKIAISPTEITAFLADNHISTDEGSNTKLLDEHVMLILEHFGKDLPAVPEEAEHPVALEISTVNAEVLPVAITVEAAIVTAVAYDEIVENQANEGAVEVVQMDAAEIDAKEVNGVSEAIEEKPALIKAVKVELSGLKVLGKIELPQTRKKEDEPGKNDDVTDKLTEPLASPDRRIYSGERKQDRGKRVRPGQGQRPGKNPVALEREREAREAEEKRQEHAMQEKERRTQYYQQRVKASVPTKPARIFDEPVTDMINDRSTSSKSWFTKFFRWFKS